MGTRLDIHPENPQDRHIRKVVDALKKGGVVIYPTDTVYAIGCDITNKKALEKVCRIKGIKPEKSQFSCICKDMAEIGSYAIQISTPVYKIMKRALPGPYTFILQASKEIPRHFQSRRKTVGVRVSDHPIPAAIVRELGRPIMSTSLKDEEGVYEYDPDEIFSRYGNLVDVVVIGGWGGSEPSTVIDCSDDDEIEVLREGLGSLDIL
ncbi:MAG: L-threonylcarbamoyladenylate synthase [Bacteroidota bacterium]